MEKNAWWPGHLRTRGRSSRLAVLLLTLGLLLAVAVAGAHPSAAQPVKNMIYMIGDGMGFLQLDAARVVKGSPLTIDTMPIQHRVQTASADNPVTDSAAAGTAHATGFRTNNGMVGLAPDGRELTSILKMAQAAGKATGVVVTDIVYGATPGSYLANVNHRNEQDAILEQTLFITQPDILLGGGTSVFQAIRGPERLADTPYTLITTRDELLAWDTKSGGPLLGLFASGTMTYEVDRPASEPHIAEMVRVALEILAESEEGFFLMVEGSRIDHASHANDLRRAVFEALAFDEAVAVALEFAAGRDDTLVVVTADHETGGLRPPTTTPSPQVIASGVATVADQITRALRNDPAADVTGVFAQYAGITDLSSHIEPGTFDDLIRAVLSARAHNYTSTGHSDAPVPSYAYGPGAERFAKVQHIVDMGRTAIELLGVGTGGDL